MQKFHIFFISDLSQCYQFIPPCKHTLCVNYAKTSINYLSLRDLLIEKLCRNTDERTQTRASFVKIFHVFIDWLNQWVLCCVNLYWICLRSHQMMTLLNIKIIMFFLAHTWELILHRNRNNFYFMWEEGKKNWKKIAKFNPKMVITC